MRQTTQVLHRFPALNAIGAYWELSQTIGDLTQNNILTMDDSYSFRLMNTKKIRS